MIYNKFNLKAFQISKTSLHVTSRNLNNERFEPFPLLWAARKSIYETHTFSHFPRIWILRLFTYFLQPYPQPTKDRMHVGTYNRMTRA